jgi:hypothetical protein
MMLRNFITILTSAALLTSCSTADENKTADSLPAEKKSISSENCYTYTGEGDTVVLKIIREQDSIVTGTLIYDFNEKDKNTGTIKGVMKDNYLIADYIFMSEAIESTRHVAFKLEGDSFIEGYGDALLNNTTNFTTVRSLEFLPKFKLTKTVCE